MEIIANYEERATSLLVVSVKRENKSQWIEENFVRDKTESRQLKWIDDIKGI